MNPFLWISGCIEVSYSVIDSKLDKKFCLRWWIKIMDYFVPAFVTSYIFIFEKLFQLVLFKKIKLQRRSRHCSITGRRRYGSHVKARLEMRLLLRSVRVSTISSNFCSCTTWIIVVSRWPIHFIFHRFFFFSSSFFT